MQRKLNLVLLISLLMLSGCVSGVAIKKAPPDTVVMLSEEDALIFGRVRWIQNREERKSYSSYSMSLGFGFRIALRVLRIEDMKKGTIEVEKDGSFFVSLPKGTYIIHRLDWADSWGGDWLVPKVAFHVAEDRHSSYLGTLNVNIRTERTIFGDPIMKGLEIHIEDEEGKAMEAYHKRYPQQEVKVVKTLMTHDPSIPRIEGLETQKTTLDTLGLLLGVAITSPPLSP